MDDLDGLPRTWQEVLRSTSGVYLLTDATGKHYVGSAKGGDGFLGRCRSARGQRDETWFKPVQLTPRRVYLTRVEAVAERDRAGQDAGVDARHPVVRRRVSDSR